MEGEEDSSIFSHFKNQKEERKRRLAAEDESLHDAILSEDIERVKGLLSKLSVDEINARDRRGNPPLHIATHLQNEEIIKLLLESDADITWKNGGGWSCIQEAMAGGNIDILSLYMDHTKEIANQKFEERVPQAIETLKNVPDFYMELSWAFGSWVPLVSKFCPYDNYKIWKKGSCVRVDTTLIGFENLQWIRGSVSFLFSTHLEGENSHVAIINHQKKKVEFAFDSFKKYSLQGPNKNNDLTQVMSQSIMRMQLLYDNIEFTPAKTWLGYTKNESIGSWKNANIYNVSGIERVSIKRNRKKKASEGPATIEERNINIEEYKNGELDPENPKGIGLLHSYESIKKSSKAHTAKVWITKDFPVKLEDLLPIFAILSPNGKHFEKLKEFLSVPLPEEGFPVKIEIPVFPTIKGTATFGTFDINAKIDDSLFTIPEDYEILKNKSMIFKESKRQPTDEEKAEMDRIRELLKNSKSAHPHD